MLKLLLIIGLAKSPTIHFKKAELSFHSERETYLSETGMLHNIVHHGFECRGKRTTIKLQGSEHGLKVSFGITLR